MKKLIIGAIGLTALTVTAAAATASRDCGYNSDGTFNIGNGQVAAHGTWEDARSCAMEGLLPAIVAERLGSWGSKGIQLESNFLRSHNTQVKKEKEKREVEVQPLPAAK